MIDLTINQLPLFLLSTKLPYYKTIIYNCNKKIRANPFSRSTANAYCLNRLIRFHMGRNMPRAKNSTMPPITSSRIGSIMVERFRRA